MNKTKLKTVTPSLLLMAITLLVLILTFPQTSPILWEGSDLGGDVLSVDWSPDGTKIAIGGKFGRMIVFSSSGQRLWGSPYLGGDVLSVDWSPDGDKVMARVGNKILVFSSSGQKIWEKGDLGDSVYSVAWSPDGSKIAIGTKWYEGGYHGKVIVLSTLNGEVIWESPDLDGYVKFVVWSPDGTKIAIGREVGYYVYNSSGCYGFGNLVVFSSSGQRLWESQDLCGYPYYVAWSSDSSKIAVGIGWESYLYNKVHGGVVVFSSSGDKLWESEDLGRIIKSVIWSLDGDKVIGINDDEIVVFSSSGDRLWDRYLSHHISSIAWSPDGTKIAIGTLWGNISVLSISDGSIIWQKDLGGSVRSVAFSPDGGKIVAGTSWGNIFVLSSSILPIWVVWLLGVLGFGASFVLFFVLRHVWNNRPKVVLRDTDLSYLFSEIVDVIRSSRDVSRALSLYNKVKEVCSDSSSGICSRLEFVSELLNNARKVDRMLSTGRDSSRRLNERLEILEEARGICRKYGLWCNDVESAIKEVRTLAETKTGHIRSLLSTASSLLTRGKFSEVAGLLAEISQLCSELNEGVNECSSVKALKDAVMAVENFLDRGISVEVVGNPVVGFPFKLKVVGKDQGILKAPLMDVVVDFSEALKSGVTVKTKIVKLPPIKPGSSTEVIVEGVANTAGDFVIPWRICAGDLCVKHFTKISITKGSAIPTLAVSMKDLSSILSLSISGLVPGYGCIPNYAERKVMLKQHIAPEGFEGEWSCCPLGCGGWGCAYLCRRKSSEVVFKVPRGFEGIFEKGFVPTVHVKLLEKVKEEAEVIKALKHPNILKVLGVATAAPVIAYEFGNKGSVEWQLAKGWFPRLRDSVLLGIQIADALRYIHSRGLMHGDIKPGNVFFVGDVAKVGDFSTLTRLITSTSSHSRFGFTPGFRAPEQVYADVRRKAIELGIESKIDVYLFGNLLLYTLTGKSVDGEDALRPDTVEEAVAGIEHEALKSLIRGMLNPEPWERPSMEEIVRELLRIYRTL